MIRIITLAGDPDAEASLAARLDGQSQLELYMRCMDRIATAAALRVGALDAVVAVGAPQWLDPELVEEIRAAGVNLVGMAGDPFEAEHLLQTGVLLVGVDVEVSALVAACSSPAPVRETLATEGDGRLEVVWGPKGAPGRTRFAIELAYALAAARPQTVLVDADTYGGDAEQLLGVQEELPTIVWAARMALKDELDAALIAESLRRVGPAGPVLLPGLARAELWPEIADLGWQRLIASLRRYFDHCVVDAGFCLEPDDPVGSTPEGRNDVARTAVAQADHLVAVLRATPTGLRHFIWAYQQVAELIDEEKVLVVANGVPAGTESEMADLLRRRIGKRPMVAIPGCDRELERAVRAARPLHEVSPRSHLVEGARTVAGALGGAISPRGVLARLVGRRG